MKRAVRITGTALLALGLMASSSAVAQDSDADLRKEIEALKAGQLNMQKQLNEIKRLVQQQNKAAAAPARPAGPQVKDVAFDLGNNEVKGDRAATLTLLEFTDYQ
jgi:protein-disulfide isomerase